MWHPEDTLVVPLRHSDGHLLGILGRRRAGRPAASRTDDDLDVLVALAAHAALAHPERPGGGRPRRHRDALEQLLQVSSQLTETFSIEAILQSVCDGIHRALGFQKLSIELPDPDTGRFVRARRVRLGADDTPSISEMTLAELVPMMDPSSRSRAATCCRPTRRAAASTSEHWQYHSEMSGAGRRHGPTTGCSCRSTTAAGS